jgi:phage shock protein A
MNMLDRVFRVITSNVNSIIKGLEDPEKVLDQAVNDMQNDLIKIRQSYAEISATQKRMISQKQQADSLANVHLYYSYFLSFLFRLNLICINF